jgi:O-antigen/teichoic acid export membrane protein
MASVVASLGIGFAGVRFVPAYNSGGDARRLKGLLYAAAWVPAVSAAGWAIVFGGLYSLWDDHTPRGMVLPLLLFFVLQTVTTSTIELMRALTWAIHAIVFTSILTPLLIIGGIFALGSRAPTNASDATWISVTAYAIVLIVQIATFWRRASVILGHASRAIYEIMAWCRLGVPLVLALALSQITFYVDTGLVAVFRSSEELGVYRIATQLSYMLAFVPSTIYSSIGGLLAREFYNQDRLHFERTLRRIHLLIYFPTGLVALGLIICAGTVLSLFGPEFTQGQWPMVIVVGSSVLRLALGPSDLLLILGKGERWRLMIEALTLAIAATLGLLLIPRFGLIGAATAHAVSWLWSALVLYALAVKVTGIRLVHR